MSTQFAAQNQLIPGLRQRGTHIAVLRSLIILAVFSAADLNRGLAQVPPTSLLEIDAENIVSYTTDVFDASKFANEPNLTTLPAPPKNFAFVMAVGDIIAVNGKPARGALVVRQQSISLSPTPSPGQAVADIVRTAVSDYLLEVQQADGTPVGNIHCLGLSGGTSAAGGPIGGGNLTVAGGTGAFVGAKGQMATSLLPGGPGPRVASVTEDPAQRRIHGGGGRVRFSVQLIPMTRPAIVSTGNGPAISHARDFAPVTSTNPVRPGEILSLIATGLGPTQPTLDPGKSFPGDPLSVVNSPVEVAVNDLPAEVIAAVGYPGSMDAYQVNFRVPMGTVSGSASIRVRAAWIPGPEVQIPVQ